MLAIQAYAYLSGAQFSGGAVSRDAVVPILAKTPSGEEYAAIAASAKTPEPARLRAVSAMAAMGGVSGIATPKVATALYAEAEFRAEVAAFLRDPVLSLKGA